MMKTCFFASLIHIITKLGGLSLLSFLCKNWSWYAWEECFGESFIWCFGLFLFVVELECFYYCFSLSSTCGKADISIVKPPSLMGHLELSFFFGILLLLYLILDCFDTVGIDFYCLETGVIGNLSFLVDTCVSIPIGISWRVMYPLPIGPSVSGPNPSEEI